MVTVVMMNMLEEIDMPGEYYIDSEKGVMYFCGIGDMNNPVLSVADENVAMMSFAAALVWLNVSGA